MTLRRLALPVFAALTVAAPSALHAQTFPTDDPVIRRIWEEGMTERSQAFDLSQALMDSIGPRLMGAPQYDAAADWIASRYAAWGVEAERHVYGTWVGWDRGSTHIDLVSPRKRTLSGMMLAWSQGTNGPIEAEVLMLPRFASRADFDAWLPGVRGRIVAITLPEPTCREDQSWQDHATPQSFARMQEERNRARAEWAASIRAIGNDFVARIEDAGAVAVLEGLWSAGWGVDKIFDASMMSTVTALTPVVSASAPSTSCTASRTSSTAANASSE
jgi:hypothetical protein